MLRQKDLPPTQIFMNANKLFEEIADKLLPQNFEELQKLPVHEYLALKQRFDDVVYVLQGYHWVIMRQSCNVRQLLEDQFESTNYGAENQKTEKYQKQLKKAAEFFIDQLYQKQNDEISQGIQKINEYRYGIKLWQYKFE